MLNAMRNGAHSKIIKFILFSFLVLAVGGMALMDVGGFFRGGVGMNVVAKAGNESITSVSFDNTVRRTLAQQGLPAQEAYKFGLVDQILQNEIGQRLMTQAGFDLGIYVGDDIVTQQINQLIAPAAKSQPGVSKKQLLQTMLRNQGMTEADFIAAIRRSMMNTVLQTTIQSAALPMPRQEALNIYTSRNETRTLDALIIPHDSVKDIEPAQEEVLTAFYEAAKASRYSIPETRSFTIAVVNEDNAKSAVTISDDELQAAYNRAKSTTYSRPERRLVQQAVLTTKDEADKVVAALEGDKAALKDAVKTVTGKEIAYLGEQTYEEKGLIESVAGDTFAADVDAPVGPIQTPLGYHILIVKKILPPEQESFESVRESIRKDLMQSRQLDAVTEAANTIDDRLAGGEDLAVIAKETGMKTTTIGPIRNDGSTPDNHEGLKGFEADREYILQTVFDLNEGEVAPVLELGDGRYAAIRLDSVQERNFKPYESVKAELAKNWIADQKAAANTTRANALQQDIASGKKTLADVAKELSLKTESITIKRGGDAPEKIGEAARNALFEPTQGESAATEIPNGYVVAVVKSITLPDASKITDADLKPIITESLSLQRSEMVQSYMQATQKDLGVRINRSLLESIYNIEASGS